jgi:hypothetical protein
VYRLIARGEINDAETRVSETDGWCDVKAEAVGAAVLERMDHALEHCLARWRFAAAINITGNATHIWILSPWRCAKRSAF